jgi:4-amino-4-deoxy-L-arabinose transferase-like glycosyltransferase
MLKNKIPQIIIIILGLCALTVIVCSFFWPMAEDEGIFLTIASRITHGELPYRDYFDHKPPGIYYFLAPIITIFGNSLFAARFAIALTNLGTAFIIFKIGQKAFGKQVGFLSGGIFLFLTVLYQGFYAICEPPMVFSLAVGIFFFQKTLTKPNLKLSFLAGLSIGAAILFKQPAILNAIITAFFFYQLSKKQLGTKMAAYFLGLVLPITILIFYFWAKGAIFDFLYQTVTVNFTNYLPQSLDFAAIPKLFFPGIVFWFILIFALFKQQNDKNSLFEKFLIFSTIAPLVLILTRPYHHYLIQTLPFAGLLLGNLIKNIFWQKKGSWLLQYLIVSFLIINLILATLIFFEKTKNQNWSQLKTQYQIAESLKNKTLLALSPNAGFYFLADANNSSTNCLGETIENYKIGEKYPNLQLLIFEQKN